MDKLAEWTSLEKTAGENYGTVMPEGNNEQNQLVEFLENETEKYYSVFLNYCKKHEGSLILLNWKK